MRSAASGNARGRVRSFGGFTLIELLVVVAIISLLIGILVPSLGRSRDAARRVKCLANLRSIGMGLRLYMDTESGDLLPLVLPLQGPGGLSEDPALLDLLERYLDAPQPRRDPDQPAFFVSSDPYVCPADRSSSDADQQFEPVWRSFGTSYEYFAGGLMLYAEVLLGRDPGEIPTVVTRHYENHPKLPVLVDGDTDENPWHPRWRNRSLPQRDALYFDGHADWQGPILQRDLELRFGD